MAKEKAKHDGLLCFSLALIVVLIVAIGGGAYYFLVADNGENANIIEEKEKNTAKTNSKISKKDISVIEIDGTKYDLTKTIRDLGIEIDDVNDVTSDDISNFNELKNSDDVSFDDEDQTMDIYDDLCEDVIVKAGQTIECRFDDKFGGGEIRNTSNKDKSILDCNITNWYNFYTTVGGGSLKGLEIGKSTEEDVVSKFGGTSGYSYTCEDGSSVNFRYHDEYSINAVGKEYLGTIKSINIELEYDEIAKDESNIKDEEIKDNTLKQEEIDEIVEKNIKKYIELVDAGTPIQWLDILGITQNAEMEYTNIVGDWITTDIKYGDFEKEITKYVTKNIIETSIWFDGQIKKEDNGTISFVVASKGGLEIIDMNISLLEQKEDVYIYEVKIERDLNIKEKFKANVKKVNSNYLVDNVYEETEY